MRWNSWCLAQHAQKAELVRTCTSEATDIPALEEPIRRCREQGGEASRRLLGAWVKFHCLRQTWPGKLHVPPFPGDFLIQFSGSLSEGQPSPQFQYCEYAAVEQLLAWLHQSAACVRNLAKASCVVRLQAIDEVYAAEALSRPPPLSLDALEGLWLAAAPCRLDAAAIMLRACSTGTGGAVGC